MQNNDIDVSIPSKNGATIYISEKSRRQEYYDFEFELWRNFKNKKYGYSVHHFEQVNGYFGPDILIKYTPNVSGMYGAIIIIGNY